MSITDMNRFVDMNRLLREQQVTQTVNNTGADNRYNVVAHRTPAPSAPLRTNNS